MQREIKFRGKRLDNGERVYGHYLYDSENNKGFIAEYFEDKSAYFREVVPETVGEYTGLKDKNGKEIYEGDIVIYQVNTPVEQTAIIKWENGGFILTDWSDKTTDQYLPDFWYAPTDVEITEVIGNIYENLELLKGE